MFLPYMGMAAIWFNGVKQIEQIVNTPFDRRPLVKSGEKLVKRFQRRRLKDYTLFIHVHSLGARADNFQGQGQNSDCN